MFQLSSLKPVFTWFVILVTFQLGYCYPSNLKETGPISKQLFDDHPQLAFLGQFNNKYFYVDRVRVNQDTAENGCKTLGMKLAIIDSQEELDFISTKTIKDDDAAWTDGQSMLRQPAFRWKTTSVTLTERLAMEEGIKLGLGIKRQTYPIPTWLRPALRTDLRHYICYI